MPTSGAPAAGDALGELPEATVARAVGLFLILAILTETLILPGLSARAWPQRSALDGAFALCVAVHIWVTLYDGRFTRWRTVTWLALIGLRFAAEFTVFIGYILPWGQMAFWLVARAAEVPILAGALDWWLMPAGGGVRSVIADLWAGCPLAVLLIDLAGMHAGDRRRASRPVSARLAELALLVAAALLAAVASDAILARYAPLPEKAASASFRIIPPWFALPTFAVLRAVPDKLGGAALAFALMLLPAIWPWVHADRVRARGPSGLHLALCVGLALAWIALGVLGARRSDDATLVASRVAVGYVVAYFIAIVPLLGRSAFRSAPSSSSRGTA